MKRMKTIMILCIVFVLVLSTACDTKANNESNPTTTAQTQTVQPASSEATAASAKDITLVVSRWSGDPYESANRDLLAQYTQKTGIKTEMDAVPWENLRDKQALELASGNHTYDVLQIYPVWYPEFINSGYLYEMGKDLDQTFKDSFLPSLLNLSTYNGKIYGLPEWIATILLAYRTDLIQEAGVTSPKSWEDLLTVAKYFNGKDGMYGISFPAKKGGDMSDIFSSFLAGTGAWYYKDGKPAIDAPQTLELIKFLKEIATYAPEGILNFHWDDTMNLAMTGKAAMTICNTSSSSWFDDPSKSQTVGKWGYVPISYKGNPGGLVTSYFWSVANDSKNIKEALDLAKFLSGTEAQTYFSQKQSTCGATKDFYLNQEVKKYVPALDAMNKAFTNGFPVPAWDKWTTQQETLETNLQNVISGTETPEDAMKAIVAAIN